uniref:NADH dehydrogenase subunit 6 n=1 Tax=Patelloida saccharinoides TaxID=225156 RepID=UPI0023D7DAC9|nr:NADH dehydrogenase subunit 6 [Patelloida saccharinoides]WCR50863.1 NADH dehydrogenase subunit 6 [Patelloida saccharinoides]
MLALTPTLLTPWCSHPLPLLACTVPSIIMLSITMALMQIPVWLPAVFLLVMAGGLLVVFSFISCLTPSLKHPYRLTLTQVLLLACFFILSSALLFFFLTGSMDPYSFSPKETSSLSKELISSAKSRTPVALAHKTLLLFSVGTLTTSMIAVVKICNCNRGPLRPFKKGRK